MKMRTASIVGALGVVAMAAAGLKFGTGIFAEKAGAAPTPPPAAALPVPVTPVVKRNLPIYLEYPARLESIRNVTLRPKVTGFIAKQETVDGSDVQTGQLLYKIDARDFEAALDQAKAQKERDTAALDYARANLGRGAELTKSGFLAKDAFDLRTSTAQQGEAAVALDNAALRQAELNLSYTEIRAPFPGRLGKNLAPEGTLVSSAAAPLNTLVQLDPIYVTFNPNEAELDDIRKARAAGAIKVEVYLPGKADHPHAGELSFIDNSVDPNTGTVTLRATIHNADFALIPGQFVKARVLVREQADALLVPQTSVGSSQVGKYVYVVGQTKKAEQRLVTLGATDGPLVAAVGVRDGDSIISGNFQKIAPGSPIEPIVDKPSK